VVLSLPWAGHLWYGTNRPGDDQGCQWWYGGVKRSHGEQQSRQPGEELGRVGREENEGAATGQHVEYLPPCCRAESLAAHREPLSGSRGVFKLPRPNPKMLSGLCVQSVCSGGGKKSAPFRDRKSLFNQHAASIGQISYVFRDHRILWDCPLARSSEGRAVSC
jgi:hypothetical protein